MTPPSVASTTLAGGVRPCCAKKKNKVNRVLSVAWTGETPGTNSVLQSSLYSDGGREGGRDEINRLRRLEL